MKQINVSVYYQNGEHKTITSFDTAAKVVREEAKAASKDNPVIEASAFTVVSNGYTHNATFKMYNGKLTNRNAIVKAETLKAIRGF